MPTFNRLACLMTILLSGATTLLAQPPKTVEPTSARQTDWHRVFVATSDNETTFAQSLTLPPVTEGEPAAGKRVAITPPEYAGTQVHHMLYLPEKWDADWPAKRLSFPVIVEFTGNDFPASGSTGKVEDAGLGLGISRGQFIWVTMPFIAEDGKQNQERWWGDEAATVEYVKKNLPRICKIYGGDPAAVFLCGFSRGAIGVNYIGLHDEQIAKLWRGFIAHDHYDGVRAWNDTPWGAPLKSYRVAAAKRLHRLNNRPCLVTQCGSTQQTRDYLQEVIPVGNFTFLDLDMNQILGPFPNEVAIHPHTDRWLLKDSPERRQVWRWIADVLSD